MFLKLPLFLKLIVQQQRSHPTRFFATVFALACSVSAIVWMVGGYERLFSRMDENAERFLGRFQALVAPGSLPAGMLAAGSPPAGSPPAGSPRSEGSAPPARGRGGRGGEPPTQLPPAILDALKGISQVHEIVLSCSNRVSVSSERLQASSIEKLVKDRAPVLGAPPLDPVLIASQDPLPLYSLDVGQWLDGTTVVIGQNVAQSLQVELGDSLRVTSDKAQTDWKIGGIVNPPEDAPAFPTLSNLQTNAIYVTPKQYESILGEPFIPSHAHLLYASGSEGASEVTKRVRQAIQDSGLSFAVLDDPVVAQGLARSRKLNSSKGEAWSVALLASLASVIVIGAIMSAVVRERSRELAMLRAIGWTRSKVLLSLLLETMLLTMSGWALGILAGHWLVQTLVPGPTVSSSLLPGKLTLISSFLCVTAGAIVASIIPLWRAGQLAPIDAMNQGSVETKERSLSKLSFLGMLLIFLGLLANSPLAADRTQQLTWVRWAAYPCLLAGFACFLPLFTQAIIRIAGPILASLFRIDRQLLVDGIRQKSTMWASLAFALSIGLSILLATQIWGNSMLQTFLPGKWIPDALIAIKLSDSDASRLTSTLWDDLRKLPEVNANTVAPLYVEQAKIAWPSGETKRGLGADNAVVIGLDSTKAFSGDAPLLNVEWTESDPTAAIQLFQSENGCIVSEDFCIRNNSKLGDELKFDVPNKRGEQVSFKIVGVVRMTGWHWLTKFSGLRKRYVRTGALIFADAEVVRVAFGLQSPEFCFFNTRSGADLDALEKAVASMANASMQEPAEASAPWLRFTARDWIDESIRIRSEQYIWAMCYLPLYTMLLFSCAVACTLFSFVKMRSWELGVVRSLGFSRWFLVRWIAAEGLFLAIVVGAISILFGMVAGWGGLSLARYEGFFAGPAPWVLPPKEITIGLLMTILLCGLSILWPAWYVGTKPLLDLLQSKSSSRQ